MASVPITGSIRERLTEEECLRLPADDRYELVDGGEVLPGFRSSRASLFDLE